MNLFVRVSPEGVKLTIGEENIMVPSFAVPYLLSVLADVNLDFHKMATIQIPVDTVHH